MWTPWINTIIHLLTSYYNTIHLLNVKIGAVLIKTFLTIGRSTDMMLYNFKAKLNPLFLHLIRFFFSDKIYTKRVNLKSNFGEMAYLLL